MLASIAKAPTWKSSGHICCACRLRLGKQRGGQDGAPVRQIRHESSAATESNGDTWEEGFNDIARTYGPSQSRSKTDKDKSEPAAADAPGQPKIDDPESSLENRIERSKAPVARRVQSLRRTNGPHRSLKSTASARCSTPAMAEEMAALRRLVEGLKADLTRLATTEPRHQADVRNPGVNTKKLRVSGVQEAKRENTSETVSGLTREAQDERSSATQAETNEAMTTIAEPIESTLPRSISTNGRGSSMYTATPADSVPVLPGQTARPRKGIQEPPPGRAQASAQQLSTKPQSLSDKIREARLRTPWGGLPNAAADTSPDDASFESLRKADNVSVKRPVLTTLTSKPFGLRSTASSGTYVDKPIDAVAFVGADGESGAANDLSQSSEGLDESTTVSLLEDHGDAVARSHADEAQVAPEDLATENAEKDLESGDAAQFELPTSPERSEDSQGPKPLTKSQRRKANKKARKAAEQEQTAEDVATEAELAESPTTAEHGETYNGQGLAGQSLKNAMLPEPPSLPSASVANVGTASITPADLEITPLDLPQPPVPYLQYGLDRVLFNEGIHQLQDPASRVYNFEPYLQKIMPVIDFDFDSLKQYKTSSQDEALAGLAREYDKRYIGSTSSMTGVLSQFHFLLSNYRPLNLNMFSKQFLGRTITDTFTKITRAPSAIFLRWKNGSYAIDADKQWDSPNVLMMLGKSMELLLTMPTSDYERYRKSDPREVPEELKTAPESYQYTTMGDFLMRSQLDAYDPRLPGNGTFDLKTRAVVSVRMSSQDVEPMTGYELYSLQGKYGSYEREYYDMMRATMLKYMLQARMGRMNGIFVAYHNVKRIFGFEYVPMSKMDLALHGQVDACLGDQEFRAGLDILNKLFDQAAAKFPQQSLRFHFETQQTGGENSVTALHCFAEPMAEKDIDTIQNSQKAKMEAFEREMMGMAKSDEEAASETTANASDGAKDTSNVEGTTASYNTTDSDADPNFMKAISIPDKDLSPLFYATIIVQSQVNGAEVQNARPVDLKPTDKWTIDYLMKEYDITRREWALYEDMKARRKDAFWVEEDEDGVGDGESGGRVQKSDGYRTFLRELANKGRLFREKMEGLDEGREVVLLKDGLPQHREKIEDLEDYMAWLYKKTG